MYCSFTACSNNDGLSDNWPVTVRKNACHRCRAKAAYCNKDLRQYRCGLKSSVELTRYAVRKGTHCAICLH